MSKVVNPDDIEQYGGRVQDVLKPLIVSAKDKLSPLELAQDALGSQGTGAVQAHNSAQQAHVENLEKGIETIQALADGLRRTARNWRTSDEPFVER